MFDKPAKLFFCVRSLWVRNQILRTVKSDGRAISGRTVGKGHRRLLPIGRASWTRENTRSLNFYVAGFFSPRLYHTITVHLYTRYIIEARNDESYTMKSFTSVIKKKKKESLRTWTFGSLRNYISIYLRVFNAFVRSNQTESSAISKLCILELIWHVITSIYERYKYIFDYLLCSSAVII